MNDQMDPDLPLSITLEVRDRCLCFRSQRFARLLARHFDDAFRPFGLGHGQFSLMMALNRPDPPRLSDLAEFLAMDRTTLTAAAKVLDRRGLIEAYPDPVDGRVKRLRLTPEGRNLLKQAVPVWRATHDTVDKALDEAADTLRAALMRLG